jgi:hypothetical protein
VSSRIQDDLELILAAYADARRTGPFGSRNELWDVFNDLKEALSTCAPAQRRPTLRVAWSAGKGNWANIPWLALLDERETQTTQHGVYCVFLFRQDMSGVYLTFNQGVTEPKTEFGRPKPTRSSRRGQPTYAGIAMASQIRSSASTTRSTCVPTGA